MDRSGIRFSVPRDGDVGTIIVLDAVVVAPLFERSYAMFRGLIGTWP
jgi:hypothetical protein